MDTEEIVLSVVIPCYNDGRFLPEAVDSVQAVAGGKHEIIVVNDGSTDSLTLRVLDEIAGRGLQVINQTNKGLGAARNCGIAACRGRYVLPLDSDNRIRPEYIPRGIEVLDRTEAIDVVYGDAEYFGDRTGSWKIPDFQFHRILQANFIDACAIFRKTAWTRVNGYDEKMPSQGREDWDFWLRISLSGGQFLHLKQRSFDYRVRQDAMSDAMLSAGESIDKITQHIRRKSHLSTIGEIIDLHQSWNFAVREFRASPLRTLCLLILRAYLPWFRPTALRRAFLWTK